MINPRIHGPRLHFPWAKLVKALNEVRSARQIRPLYGAKTGPGLWLVGDEGVYLMPNTSAEKRTIVYARECDPAKLAFETWWGNKSATFGTGDGVEFIALQDIDAIAARFLENLKRPQHFCVDISEEEFTIGML